MSGCIETVSDAVFSPWTYNILSDNHSFVCRSVVCVAFVLVCTLRFYIYLPGPMPIWKVFVVEVRVEPRNAPNGPFFVENAWIWTVVWMKCCWN